MPTHSQVIERWAAQINGEPETRSMRGCHVYAEGRTIYSYGRHFPMATIMDGFVLVNGDTWGSTTSHHQSQVRSALHTERSLIVPFSALQAASIDFETIRPCEIMDDRWMIVWREMSLGQLESRYTAAKDERGDWSVPDERVPYRQWVGGQAPRVACEKVGNRYRVPIFRHWLGEAVFTATVSTQEIYTNADGHRDHRTRRRKARFLSAFDHNETENVYFLCELPAESQAETVDQALDDLAPPIVKLALARDIAVKRQGDMFAIPCELPAEITRPAPFKRGTAVYKRIPFRAPRIVEDIDYGPLLSDRYRNRFRPRAYAERDYFSDRFSVWPSLPRYETVRWSSWSYERTEKNGLHGTDHTATEVLRPETGETYARGILRHEPSGRAPDHAKQTLDGWHLIVPNACPR